MMAAQSTVAGLSVVIGSAIAFSWKSTDVLDMERQRAMRHSMSGKYSEGDDELVTYIKRQASPMTPDSPQQILQMQQMRHEFTGKLCP
mmetsp:Transcript_27543/g.65645  ORF Transcript_27543/g.65645 Transcript_27543/m.65645 type:complete len:88 (-) Transcript_27543:211-474(-)